MRLFIEYLDTLVEFCISNPMSSKSEAISELRNAAAVTNAEAGAFLDEVASYYEARAINGSSTWSSFRNGVVNDGVEASFLLIESFAPYLETLTSAEVVVNGLLTQELLERRGEINFELDFIRAARDALPSATAPSDAQQERWLRRAYTMKIRQLLSEKRGLGI